MLDGPGGGFDKIHRMVFDDAVESGLLNRTYEPVIHGEAGLPNGSARNATDGFRYLVDEGCLAGGRGLQLRQRHRRCRLLANELEVPLISWVVPTVSGATTASGSAMVTAGRCGARGLVAGEGRPPTHRSERGR
ncbi:MAG: hypothetical protein R2695_12710 [Acidimicrobiales bacterium]